jgi:hypothetical protein
MATPTNCEPALESVLQQYWEFSCSINTSIDSALRSQNSESALLNQKSEFARLINSSVKHRWPSSYILLKINGKGLFSGSYEDCNAITLHALFNSLEAFIIKL